MGITTHEDEDLDKQLFPRYHRATEARCFSCNGPLVNVRKTHFPDGHGKYVGLCTGHNRSALPTWFDLDQEPAEELGS